MFAHAYMVVKAVCICLTWSPINVTEFFNLRVCNATYQNLPSTRRFDIGYAMLCVPQLYQNVSQVQSSWQQ